MLRYLPGTDAKFCIAADCITEYGRDACHGFGVRDVRRAALGGDRGVVGGEARVGSKQSGLTFEVGLGLLEGE